MQILIKYRSMSTSLGFVRNGDIVDLPEDEVRKIMVTKPLSIEILPELPIVEPKPAPVKRATRKKKDVKPIN